MNDSSPVDRLAALPGLAEIPRDQIEWLVDHGEVRHFEDGATLYRHGKDIPALLIVLSGRFSVRAAQDGPEREVREVVAGRVSGYLPFTRAAKQPRGYLVAIGPCELLLISPDDIPEMVRECFEFTAYCVHEMLDRARAFKADDKVQEKMAALGRLSAGLAHELNNPTSAIGRAAGDLDPSRVEIAAASRALGAAALGGPALAAVDALELAALRKREKSLSSIEGLDAEDQFVQWLSQHHIDTELAYPLAGTALTCSDLDSACSALDDRQLTLALRYVAAQATAGALIASIRSATDRVHSLVDAVKKHTHMDRPSTVDSIELGGHLADTVALMKSKAASKGVTLHLRVEPDLPTVEGIVVELNQVWIQLIDNAIDAAPVSGAVFVEAGRDKHVVFVKVVDDGPGIPDDIRERVFDAFFTTKDVGQGRGLGLDIVQTVVRGHQGTVEVTSVPGRTEFCVTLPIAGNPRKQSG